MDFHERIVLMVVAKTLRYLTTDYSAKAFLTYAVIGFIMLILIFRLALNKLTVETILKLKLFYIVYGSLLTALSIFFVYMNYIVEPTPESVIGTMSKESVEGYNKQIAEQLIRSEIEIKKNQNELALECEKSALCSHLKKPNE